MGISFIVTSYNIDAYIRECLESLRPCVQDGDQVVLVDDGSTDGTVERIEAFIAEGGFGPGVLWSPVLLGANTMGGVGIPGNIGMDRAECETIFFVDGDDRMVAEGFRKTRRAYEAGPTDIRIADYLEYDQKAARLKRPADAARWGGLDRPMAEEEARLAALALIAVPWRKFYRTDFLRRHRIRYPEGDFFSEDNPFHWKVCLLAESIAFSADVVCHHRINRPGQTMASTGTELIAFFSHFCTILGQVQGARPDLRRQAIRWIIGNMSWHLPRLQPVAMYAYADAAQSALRRVSDEDWDALSAEMGRSSTWHQAAALRSGQVWQVVQVWRDEAAHAAQTRSLRNIESLLQEIARQTKGLRNIETVLHDVSRQAKTAREILQAQQAIEEFTALRALFGRAEAEADLRGEGDR